MLNQALAITEGNKKPLTPEEAKRIADTIVQAGQALTGGSEETRRQARDRRINQQMALKYGSIEKAQGVRGKQVKQLSVKTPYGTTTRKLDKAEQAQYAKLDGEGRRAFLERIQQEAIEVAKSRGLKPKEGRETATKAYEYEAPRTTEGELTKILRSVETVLSPSGANIGRGMAQRGIDAARNVIPGDTLPEQFLTGMAENTLYPGASFVEATGNLYDPTATIEERLGAAGNVGLYGLGAVSGVSGARQGIQAARAAGMTGSQVLKEGVRGAIREGTMLGGKLIGDTPAIPRPANFDLESINAQLDQAIGRNNIPNPYKTDAQNPQVAIQSLPGVEGQSFMPKPRQTQTVPQPETMVSKPVTETPIMPEQNLTSYAKQITGRDPLEGTNARKVLAQGRAEIETGRINPAQVVSEVLQTKRPVSEVEIGATLDELARMKARQSAIERESGGAFQSMDEWIALDEKIAEFENAGDIMGNQFHRIGQALQIAIREDMSFAGLQRKAKFLNNQEPLSAAQSAKIEELSKKYNDAIAELEKIKSQSSEVVEKIKRYQGTERFSQKSREQARKTAINYFSGKQLDATSTGMSRNRKRGAVNYTISNEELKARSAVRKLAKEIALDGAETLDDVLKGIRKEMGMEIKDDDLLAFIYEPYSKYKLEADLARIQSNNALNDVKRAAEFRAKSGFQKTGTVIEGVLNGLTRSMQLGADLSAPMIQGRKGITNNFKGWVKAYKPMLRSAFAGDTERTALEHLAKIESDPLYARAKAAGLEITVPGGKFTAQEENFIGNMSRVLEVLQNTRGAAKSAKVIQPYVSLMVRSENAFTSYMNDLRYSTFKKFAEIAPDDPEYLKDVSSYINVIYGRGTGNIAQAAGRLNLGRGLLAPRYLISQLQFQGGVPLFKAKSPMARTKIATEYAKYIGAVSALMYTARLMGWDAQTDPRHTDFGKISDGKVTIDIASKDVQFWRLAMQSMYGKINQVGGYKPPNAENTGANLFKFGTGKLAPMPKLGVEALFGQYTDEGKRVPIEDIPARDQVLRIAPIWVQDLVKESDKWDSRGQQALFTILGVMGQESKPRAIKDTSKPLEISKPGIYSKQKN